MPSEENFLHEVKEEIIFIVQKKVYLPDGKPPIWRNGAQFNELELARKAMAVKRLAMPKSYFRVVHRIRRIETWEREV